MRERCADISNVPVAGDPVDMARSAQLRWWTGQEGAHLEAHETRQDEAGHFLMARDPTTNDWQIGLEWDEPRDVNCVVIEFEGAVREGVRVEYWRKNWPTPAPERYPGARRGWIRRDDPFNGEWTRMRGEERVDGCRYSITADPLDLAELHRAVQQLDDAEDPSQRGWRRAATRHGTTCL